jgi:hypothetical protein
LVYGAYATFNNISVISWQSVLLVEEKTTELPQVTDLSHDLVWMAFQLTVETMALLSPNFHYEFPSLKSSSSLLSIVDTVFWFFLLVWIQQLYCKYTSWSSNTSFAYNQIKKKFHVYSVSMNVWLLKIKYKYKLLI